MKTLPKLKSLLEIKAIAAAMTREGEKSIGGGLFLRSRGGPIDVVVHYYPANSGGRRKRYNIGPLDQNPDFEKNLAIAREVLKQNAAGQDPEAARTVTPTFGDHAEAYMARHLPELKNVSSRAKWRGSLTNHCKAIWRLKVNAIEDKHVLEVLRPIWKKIPVMASEVRARIEIILDDAMISGLRSRLNHNPATWSKALGHALGGDPPKRGTVRGAMASVPFEELPALISELDAKKSQTARALIAIAMTCVRTQEFLGMRLSELDLDAEQPIWTIPHARFKKTLPNKQNFVLPLAPQVVRILKEQIAELNVFGEGEVDYIWPASFKGRKAGEADATSLSNMTMLRYLQRGMGRNATVHGFRASFRTWADDQFAPGSEVAPKYHHYAIEFCLAHIPGSAVEQAYRRAMMLKARISIMRDWANYLMAPEAADNVLPFKREQIR